MKKEGYSMIMENDEFKFGERNYYQSHRIKGTWVL